MKVVQCSYGHHFDSDTYTMCPHCLEEGRNGSVILPTDSAVKEKEPRKKALLEVIFPYKSKNGAGEKQIIGTVPEVEPCIPVPSHQRTEEAPSLSKIYEVPKTPINNDSGQTMAAIADAGTSQKNHSQVPDTPDDNVPLQQVIRHVTANEDGKTMSFFATMMDSSNKNESEKHRCEDPVVGWLVAVSGPHFGKSFQIYVGRNTIGRDNENRIVLDGDMSISRSAHAIITFEPKRCDYFVQPGTSSGLAYINGGFLGTIQKLNKQDIVELGGSKFVFVPLCGPEFSWEKYLVKKETIRE